MTCDISFSMLKWLKAVSAPFHRKEVTLMREIMTRERAVNKAKELLDKLTLTEKIGQLSQFGTSIYNNKLNIFEDRLKEGKLGSYLTVNGAKLTNEIQKTALELMPTPIPVLFSEDVIHGFRTVFPTPLAQSCSWNPEIARKGAEISAREAYAAGIKWTFSPMVDIARDPRWGRVVEGYGEDPYLCSRFAEATVKGYQGEPGELGKKNRIMATMKHLVGYGAAVGGRDYNSVDMSVQQLNDTYLPPFRAGIEAGAETVMCAFNTLNGVPCSGNRYLLHDVLREQMGFEGILVSDAHSIREMMVHGFAEDESDCAEKSIQAGMDILMAGDLFNDTVPELIAQGKLTEEQIDEAVLRFLTVKFMLGVFEEPYVDEDGETCILCPEFLNAARQTAKECIVLLENRNHILPLKKEQKVALIGPLADDPKNILGPWVPANDRQSVQQILASSTGVFAGLKNAGVSVECASGCPITGDDESGIPESVALAKNSDVAVLVLGEGRDMSGEAKSRALIRIPRIQQKLLDAVLDTGTPVVLLVSAGRPIIVEEVKDRVAALAYIWQLGSETGNAVADVLTGAYNPSGRLTMSIPRHEGQLPVYYNHFNTGRPYRSKGWYESKYMGLDPTPVYPFGYGLSYTRFVYENLSLSADAITADGEIQVMFDIRNIDDVDGETVPQLYIRDLVGCCVRPVKELKGFDKLFVKAGETVRASLTLHAKDLAFCDPNGKMIVEPGKFHLWVGQHAWDETLFAEFSVR